MPPPLPPRRALTSRASSRRRGGAYEPDGRDSAGPNTRRELTSASSSPEASGLASLADSTRRADETIRAPGAPGGGTALDNVAAAVPSVFVRERRRARHRAGRYMGARRAHAPPSPSRRDLPPQRRDGPRDPSRGGPPRTSSAEKTAADSGARLVPYRVASAPDLDGDRACAAWRASRGAPRRAALPPPVI